MFLDDVWRWKAGWLSVLGGFKSGAGGTSVAREPKWNLYLDAQQGKFNRVSQEPERALLIARMVC
jgi:hypothetical protein